MNFLKENDFSGFENIDVSKLGYRKGCFRSWSPFAEKASVIFYRDWQAVEENKPL